MKSVPQVFFGLLLITLAIQPAQAAREKALHSFAGGSDGAGPQSNVLIDSEGNIYGTTQVGGGSGCGGEGCGVVFELPARGKEKILHTFTAGTDGAFPAAGLVMDDSGNLFGTTLNGGADCQCGTVFEILPNGIEHVLYAFKGGEDGAFPLGALAFDGSRNLYGTTSSGGNDCNGFGVGCGTIFLIKPSGKHKVVYAFKGGSDGIYPAAGLWLGANGLFYGTTANGGIDCDGSGQGCGTVFQFARRGVETVLYTFKGGSDGSYPAGGVVTDNSLNIYGTTNNGGTDCDGGGAGCGTVFEVAAGGAESVLHAFQGGDDGSNPRAAPSIDANGNLYGTTASGGNGSENSSGVVFEISAGGREKILYAFTGGNDGGAPFSGLTSDPAGNFYGTTLIGGQFAGGAVFKLRHR